jgi:hypothetical protein
MDLVEGASESRLGEPEPSHLGEYEKRLDELCTESLMLPVCRHGDDHAVVVTYEKYVTRPRQHLLRCVDQQEVLDLGHPPRVVRRPADDTQEMNLVTCQPFGGERHRLRPTRVSSASATSSLTSPSNCGLRYSASRRPISCTKNRAGAGSSVRRLSAIASANPSMNLEDDQELALALFDFVNLIADEAITQPNKVKAMFDKMPKAKRDGVAQRDGTPPTGTPAPIA